MDIVPEDAGMGRRREMATGGTVPGGGECAGGRCYLLPRVATMTALIVWTRFSA